MGKFENIINSLDKEDLNKIKKVFEILHDDLIYDALKAWMSTPQAVRLSTKDMVTYLSQKATEAKG